MRSKKTKFLVSIILVLTLFILTFQNVVNAEVKESVDLDLEIVRTTVENGQPTQGRAYSLNTGDDHPVFQISSTSGNKKNTSYFCANATRGLSWSGAQAVSGVEYDTSYDLATEKNEIQNLTEAYNNVVGQYYTQILWLLDNFSVGSDFDDNPSLSVDAILAKAGIVYGNTGGTEDGQPIISYYYDAEVNPNSVFSSNEEIFENLYGNPYSLRGRGYSYVDMTGNTKRVVDVKLSKELVEVVEQAALWYFTNYGNSIYNCYSQTQVRDWLRYAQDPTAANITWNLLANEKVTVTNAVGTTQEVDVGGMLQEQASILYNYFIDGANQAAANGYTTNSAGTISISYNGTGTASLVREGTNFKVGPLEVTITGNTTIDSITATTGTSNTEISGIILKDENGNTINKVTAGQKFYVVIDSSKVDGNVTIKAKGTTNTTVKKLRIKEVTDDTQAEQPVIEIIKITEPVEATITVTPSKEFDLALRKAIIKVTDSNGKDVSIINENGLDATRNPNIVTTTIPDTATYKHRKDPVVVSTNDIVTYQISIFNEGDIDGYASIIVDQLPLGLESVLKTNDVIKSNVLGNTYNVTFDSNSRKITFSLDKTKEVKSIPAYNNNTLAYDTLNVQCKVVQNSSTVKNENWYLTNIAYIAEEYDKDGNKIEADRDGNESSPSNSPKEVAKDLNSKDADSYKGNKDNQSVRNDTNNNYYYEGEQDDDDFEKVVVLAKEFDLKLIKYISAINGKKTDRTITCDTSNLNKIVDGKKVTTATYDVSKEPLYVKTGDLVTYTFRIYNEGEVDGFAKEMTEDIPEGLEYAEEQNTNPKWKVSKDGKTISTDYLSSINGTSNLIKAFDGKTLDYKEVSVVLRVTTSDVSKIIRNEAEISKDEDEYGLDVTDRDSTPEEWKKEDSKDYYEDNSKYPKYVEDDEDYDNIRIVPDTKFDLALRKFITNVDGKDIDTRIPDVEYKNGKIIYTHPKDVVRVGIGNVVTYTLRIFNEGEIAGFAEIIEDDIPEHLEFLPSESINKEYRWKMYDKDGKETTDVNNAVKVKTDYTSKSYGEQLMKDKGLEENPNLLDAFNPNEGISESNPEYVDVQIAFRVKDPNSSKAIITNKAQIDEDADENGNPITDIDSTPDEWIDGEDDQDYENVAVEYLDLALRKFITNVDGKDVNTRIPKVEYKDGKIIYNHPKNVYKLGVGNVVIYTLRVYNEGEIAGFAEKIDDDIPEYLEFLPSNSINTQYKWKMYDKDDKETTDVKKAVRVVTDYTSKANGEQLMKNGNLKENPNLLNPFDPSKEISDTNPDFVDVKIAFKVKDPNSNKIAITNKAQIVDDADENGNPIDDIDSVPDKWKEGEDDQDYEKVGVEYFDLSLIKYVSKAIVTENGKTKTTNTGNNGSDKDIIPKVEIYRKNLNKTVVKFEFVIKVTNEGDIAGYAKEITDYVPQGLKFYKEDNEGWVDEGNNVISTKMLQNTLLQPGQSATVKVVMRWINGEKNLGLKTNTAEISEDYNDKHIPDRDSTPDNKKPGEDDISDAPVLLTVSTGILEHTVEFMVGTLIVLTIWGIGIIIIKKYVL